MLDAMNEDYVRTARAKGLSERQVLFRHVLRNSMIPVVTLFGLDFGMVVGGGAILTETVYNLDGVGLYAGEAIRSLDKKSASQSANAQEQVTWCRFICRSKSKASFHPPARRIRWILNR